MAAVSSVWLRLGSAEFTTRARVTQHIVERHVQLVPAVGHMGSMGPRWVVDQGESETVGGPSACHHRTTQAIDVPDGVASE